MNGINGFICFNEKNNEKQMLNIVHSMGMAFYSKDEAKAFAFGNSCCAIEGNNYAENNEYAIFFHGDLYNKREFTKNKEIKNEAEIVLNLLSEGSFDFLQLFGGKFVIVIYDKKNNELKIMRDRVGSKQIFYYKNDDVFIFSTELRALFSAGIIEKEISREALSAFLQLTYIPAPMCIYENVYKVRQAVIFSVEKTGKVSEEEYWNIKCVPDSEGHEDFEACKKELKELLYASVKEKKSNFDEFGAFLSGGFDSSIVVSILSDISEDPVNTFTVGYREKEYDESELAEIVAKKNKTNYRVLTLDWEKVFEDIDVLLSNLDEPFADSSLIATYAICKMARQFVPVAFMGDAGDELFAGYNKYLISYYSDKYKKIPLFLRKNIIEKAIRLVPANNFLMKKINKVISSANMSVFEQRKNLMCLGFKENELRKLMLDGYVNELNFIKSDYAFLEDADEQTRAQYIDFKTVLEGDMLPKVETAGKLSGIKTCAPILDNKIIDFAYSIPTRFKIDKSNKKIILKEAFRTMLPDELFSAQKHGFTVPIGQWLETELYEALLRYTSGDFLEKQGLFNCEYINEIIKEHKSHKTDRHSELWAFFVFQNWYERNFL